MELAAPSAESAGSTGSRHRATNRSRLASKKIMQIRSLTSLALAALASAPMFSSTAHAVALGNIASQSSLGQPLRLVIPVALVEGETLNTACLRLVSDGSQDGSPQLLAGRINFDSGASNPRTVVTTARPI